MTATMKPGDDNPLGALWSVLVLALVFSAVGFYHYRKASTFSRKGVQTEGRVVDVRFKSGHKGGKYRTVIVQFNDASGQTRKFSSNNDDLFPGDRAQVVYVSDDPKVADLVGDSRTSTMVSWIFIGLAILLWTGFGLLIYQMGKKPKRSRAKR